MVSACLKLVAAFFFALPLVSAHESFFREKTSQTLNDHVFHEPTNCLRGLNALSNYGNRNAVTTAPLHNIRKVSIDQSERALINELDQFIVTVAGTGDTGIGLPGYGQIDNVIATTAQLSVFTYGIKIGRTGDIYYADVSNNRVQKLTVSTSIITTIVGTGVSGYNADGIRATTAWLSRPYDVALDGSGNVYVADTENNRIRKVTVITGIITTIAGAGGTGEYSGDDGAATSARLNDPSGIALDGSGNVYTADYSNHRVRRVTVSTGIITTIAGTGTSGYNADNIVATSAQLYNPISLALDGSGNVYIGDYSNFRIRKVTASTGNITTIAGTGQKGYNGDNIVATNAYLTGTRGVTLDGAGNVYIADTQNNRVRKVTASTGIITTIAGTGVGGYNGDNIVATGAQLRYPSGVAVDGSDNVYITDTDNYRIRLIRSVRTASPSAAPSVSPTASPSTVPSASPTAFPSAAPSASPTAFPSAAPSASPTAFPSAAPSASPTTSRRANFMNTRKPTFINNRRSPASQEAFRV